MKKYQTTRYIFGFNKIPDENGSCMIAEKHELKGVTLVYLREIMGIANDEKNPTLRDLVDVYDLNEEQFNKLKCFVDDDIKFGKYYYSLHCRIDTEYYTNKLIKNGE